MAFWRPVKIGHDEFSLAHLEPFTFSIIPQKSTANATIAVRFHDHCFTEKFDATRHAEEFRYLHSARHESRAFCLARYELSKRLPDFVRALDGKRVTQTRDGDLVRIELTDGRKYGIFFSLRKQGTNSCTLFVMSAYPFDPAKNVAVTGEMKFNVAVALVLQGKKPKFPPRS